MRPTLLSRCYAATVFVLCANTGLLAQGFVNTYGAQLAQDGVGVVQYNGGFAIGSREFLMEPSRHVANLILTNADGSGILNNAITVPPGNVFLQAMANASGGALYLAGSSIAPGEETHNAFLLKREQNGTIAWTSQPVLTGNEQYFALEVLPDGGVVAAGVRTVAADHDAWVTRFAADGSVLWSMAAGGGTDEEAYDLAVQGNTLLLTGRQVNFGGTTDAWFAAMDLNGNALWNTSWGGSANEVGRAVEPLGSNAFLMAGTTNSYGMFDTTEHRIKSNVYLVALDLDGDTLWTRALGDTLYDRSAWSMATATNGDVIIGGERSPEVGESDAMALRVDNTGTMIWERAWDLGKEERFLDMEALPDGFVGTGWSFTALSRQVLLVRRNANGN